MTFRSVLKGIALLTGFAFIPLAVVCLLNPHNEKAYLIDIFTAPILCVCVFTTLGLALLRQRTAALCAGFAALLLGLSFWPQAFPPSRPHAPEAKPVRLLFANLWIQNPTPQRLLVWITREDPDIIALVEAGPQAQKALIKPLLAHYPYMARRYDTYIFSRYRLSKVRPRPAGYSLMTAEVAAPGGPFTLALAHLTRPWPFTVATDQPEQFARMALDLEDEHPERLIIAGDFNTTPSASGLRDFARHLELSAAPAPSGTWPAQLPGIVRIGIDNVLSGRDLYLRNRVVGPAYGSDHRPVRVDIYPVQDTLTSSEPDGASARP